ncbi:hypothetical protein [Cohnella boryungensis]|uniref:VCBS repeat-containing protein n=1 Tax=Cohnella boryungensis TaxID=768479 RepID=A0ABV8SCY4_9BACL
MIKLIALTLAIVILITGCGENRESAQPPTTQGSSPASDTHGAVPLLLDQLAADWGNTGKENEIRLWSAEGVNGEKEISLTLDDNKLSLDLTKYYRMLSGYVRFGPWIELGNRRGLVVVFDGVNEREPDQPEPAESKHYGWIVLDSNVQPYVLWSSLDQPYLAPNNISFAYAGEGDLFRFQDRFTGLDATFSVVVDEAYRKLYDPGSLSPDDMDLQPALHYNSVRALDLNGDGIDEMICTRYIPGFYRGQVLALTSYIFVLKEQGYLLNKQLLFKSLSYVGSDSYTPDNPEIEEVKWMSF